MKLGGLAEELGSQLEGSWFKSVRESVEWSVPTLPLFISSPLIWRASLLYSGSVFTADRHKTFQVLVLDFLGSTDTEAMTREQCL